MAAKEKNKKTVMMEVRRKKKKGTEVTTELIMAERKYDSTMKMKEKID